MDLSGFLLSLTQGTEKYKKERMEKLHGMWKGRKVICVGDSTQSDPEAYGEVARMFGGWIRKIFIRKVGLQFLLFLRPFFLRGGGAAGQCYQCCCAGLLLLMLLSMLLLISLFFFPAFPFPLFLYLPTPLTPFPNRSQM